MKYIKVERKLKESSRKAEFELETGKTGWTVESMRKVKDCH